MSISAQDIGLSLQKILRRTLEQTVKACSPDTEWTVQLTDALEDIHLDQCIVLTISSFRFRVMCLMHLSMNQATRDFVAEVTATGQDKLDNSAFLDYLLEMSNSLCGNLKRHLQDSCPQLGMSTPNLLNRTSLLFDDLLSFSHSAHAIAQHGYGSDALFAASVMVSVRDEKDFVLNYFNDYEEEEDSSGELELF